MTDDPIVSEIHEIRRKLLEEFDGYLEKLMDRLKSRKTEIPGQLPFNVSEAQVNRALDLYAIGELSFEAAAELSGVSRSELARHAYKRGMEPPFSETTLAEEFG